jgi:hypothetical protein
MGQVAVSAFTFLSGKVKAFFLPPFGFALEHKTFAPAQGAERENVP